MFPTQSDALGNQIKSRREQQGMTQTELSRLICMQRANLCRIEKGKGNVCWENILLICRHLNISPIELLDCPQLRELIPPPEKVQNSNTQHLDILLLWISSLFPLLQQLDVV